MWHLTLLRGFRPPHIHSSHTPCINSPPGGAKVIFSSRPGTDKQPFNPPYRMDLWNGQHTSISSAPVRRSPVPIRPMFRELPGIFRTIVFTDSIVHEGASDPVTDKDRLAVRNAIFSSAGDLGIALDTLHPGADFPPAYVSVRTVLRRSAANYPDARFTFDLSGGSKELCLALFAFAPWLGGEVYAAFDEKTARTVPLPDRTISSLLANPNHQQILAILLNRMMMKKDAAKGTVPAVPALWVPRRSFRAALVSPMSRYGRRRRKPGDVPKPVVLP